MTDVGRGLRVGWRVWRREGWVGMVREVVDEWAFDRAHGVRTWRPGVAVDAVAGVRARLDAVWYQGVPPRVMRRVLAWLPGEAREGWFVDLGCGKGRALMLALEAGFRRVAGVECSPGLAAACESNLRAMAGAMTTDPKAGPDGMASGGVEIDIRVGDATDGWMPEGTRVVFLYNPFVGETFGRVMERLAVRAGGGGGRLWVVYVNPVELEAARRAGFEEVVSWYGRGRREATVLAWGAGMGVTPDTGS